MAVNISSIRKEIVETLVKELGLQSAVDKIPTQISDNIQPVLIVPTRVQDKCLGSNATSTLYTTPADRDFYLCSASVAGISDSQAGTNNVNIKVQAKNGAQATILLQVFCGSPPGAIFNSESNSITFNPPLLLERSTNIDLAVATSSGHGCVTGYEVDSL